ncbi:hypothetical protein [Mesoterricola silvestris]|uniref:Uncharacterized protein n=1 Tax=Mesoterricola silvestris TaxID=2927979 RepID=A0AA48GTR2_9BACT|nr:hypothetical protein [Mesoterricola silvestris]BDU71596.1 hypothetical protein METEAL_07700 [Mesoterricola silvestris]
MNPRILLPVLLGTLLACGGGGGGNSTPATASSLTYADPAAATYLLKKNTALSTSGHLVLELWGPAGATGCGVTAAFTLGGTAASWHNVNAADAAGTYVANGTAFDLGAGTPILKAKLTGTSLAATVAEKGTGAPKALDKALLRIALDLKTGLAPGATATLTPDAAKCKVLLADGTLAPITIAVSGITAQ